MFFFLSWNIGFFVIFIQFCLSHRITTISSPISSRPDINFRSLMASQIEEQAAIYYASAVLKATLGCFLLNHEIMVNPR